MSPEEHKLMQFARANPDDPRSAKILSHYGADKGEAEGGAASTYLPTHDPKMMGGLRSASREVLSEDVPGVVLPTIGQMAAGPAGGAVGNVAAGALRRAVRGEPQSTFEMGKDAALGAAPGLLGKGSGMLAAGRGAMKTAGYLAGQPTQEMAAAAGPSMERVTNPALQKVISTGSPEGSALMASDLASKGRDALVAANRGLAPGQPPIKIPGDWLPYAGGHTEWMPKTMPPKTLASMADNAAGLEAYAKPGGLKNAVRAYLGRFGSPVHLATNVSPAGIAESRYISAAAQGAKRGLKLTPELQAAIENMPGQQSTPAMAQAMREYFQRGSE